MRVSDLIGVLQSFPPDAELQVAITESSRPVALPIIAAVDARKIVLPVTSDASNSRIVWLAVDLAAARELAICATTAADK